MGTLEKYHIVTDVSDGHIKEEHSVTDVSDGTLEKYHRVTDVSHGYIREEHKMTDVSDGHIREHTVTDVSHEDQVSVHEVVGLVQLLAATDFHRLLVGTPLVLLYELFL